MKNILQSLFLFFLLSNSCASAPEQAVLQGAVTDSRGVPLPLGLKPRIFIHWDASGTNIGLKSNIGIPGDLSVETDSEGHFQIDLPPGFYDVFVSAFGFSPTCRKVRINAGQSLSFNAELEVNVVVQKELGDKPF